MNATCFDSVAWYRATTSRERIAALRAAERTTQALATDYTTEDERLHLLADPIEAVRDRFPSTPPWLAALTQAFSIQSPPHFAPLQGTRRGQELKGFWNGIAPLIDRGRERVQQGVQALIAAHLHFPFDPGTVDELFFANLRNQLITMVDRTMVLELHIARLQGHLQGNTSQERFESFLQFVGQNRTALSLLEEYPVLSRQIVMSIDHWVTSSLEFLQHLCADWETIRRVLTPEVDPGMLVQVVGGAGDMHRGGRSVLICSFSSGYRIVYKPRSLAVDVHFQELLSWINNRGHRPLFRTLTIVHQNNHGWIEFIAPQSCSSLDEVKHFYERQGAYLALLYALEATDFHSENLIASGEHPMLLDLEALFHSHALPSKPDTADHVAMQALQGSVLGIGLLPKRLWANSESAGIDISGLGGIAGQFAPYPVLQWDAVGTDEMCVVRKRLSLPGDDNRPVLDGTAVDASAFSNEIAVGFTRMYQFLSEYRNDLLSNDGPIARFAENEVRVILRPTQTYHALLRESFHPDVLRDALDRDVLFDRLRGTAQASPYMDKVIAAERADLENGDIPIFTTRPNSRNLRSSVNEPIAGFFDEPGMTVVRHRLGRLSARDLQQQLWFVRSSLAPAVTEDQTDWPLIDVAKPRTSVDAKQLLAAAQLVGDRLATLALHGRHDVSWIVWKPDDNRYGAFAPIDLDLYDGLSGVALFLAYLGAITKQARYTKLAQGAVASMRRQIRDCTSSVRQIGGFAGWGGVVYAMVHLGVLWGQATLVHEAEALIEKIHGLIEQDEQLDIIGGAAGCIGSLISLHSYAAPDRILAACLRCGDRLIARAEPMRLGCGWVIPGVGQKALTGFSHGAAGISWALLRLAAVTGEERFRSAALDGISYERSLFSPQAANWPDLRQSSTQGGGNERCAFVSAWCHGAAGIGLARLQSRQYLNDPEIVTEIDTALRTTLAEGFGGNHSLCHGDLGNIELLLQASNALSDEEWRPAVDRVAAMIIESIRTNGWRCGTPGNIESPGLMIGLAGIGYQLLRLADPRRVPSVLLLEPPPLHV